ncbi:MAG: hypothetical protein GC138_00705 [Gammaproteobacteria bacterium]|nr:hypothetical protein [Gammaproteobacteria bacterium]
MNIADKDTVPGEFCLAYYIGDRKTGAITVVRNGESGCETTQIPREAESGLDSMRRPMLAGLTGDNQVVLFDPVAKTVSLNEGLPADAFPAHLYRDGYSTRAWFMNDGDKETGNDTLNCGDKGSSVTVIDDVDSTRARYLGTICVGRGHHQAAYSRPTSDAPDVPAKAYISNLKDGSLSVIGNDPEDTAGYLKVVATIDLLEADKESEPVAPGAGNNSFPHGIDFASKTGLVYNLNNGYGTVAVIDPKTDEIIDRIPFKGHSNLFATPCGRYLIGRGADRKSDPEHVIARLSVLDAAKRETVASIELADVYISKYFFSPDGSRLYLTASASGSPEQQANCKGDALLVIDLTSLPEMKVLNEVRLGVPVGTLDFQTLGDGGTRVFASLGENGEIAVLDGDGALVAKLAVAPGGRHSRLWLIGE